MISRSRDIFLGFSVSGSKGVLTALIVAAIIVSEPATTSTLSKGHILLGMLEL